MTNNKNMDLWNNVCTTDPKHTKKVTFGRSFTAIDPMYQIRKATEQFGAAGKNWGFEQKGDFIFLPTDYAAITVRVWIEKRENYIEHVGMCGLYMDKEKTKPDQDCLKKAMTDGITKGLSYFGFCADVFLGKFDDNKYVEQLAKQEQQKKEAEEKHNKAQEWVNKFLVKLNEVEHEHDLVNLLTDNKGYLAKIEKAYPELMKIIEREKEVINAKIQG